MSIEIMLTQAKAARENAYAPYSNFYVGCCLQSDDGQLFTGANVENAAYPSSQCAEASAIGNMISHGVRSITAIVVVGTGDVTCYPCGNCRQKLSEFVMPDAVVHVANADIIVESLPFSELLPCSFKL